MPIGISDEHAELAASVRKWAESQGAVEAVRAAETDPASLASWGERAAEMGLAAIALPESAGGGGGSVLDQAVALEAAAYALVPGPLLTTAVAGLLYDDPALRAGIAEGRITVGLGSTARAVLSAPGATHVSVPDGDHRHVLVPADGVRVVPGPSVDLSRTVGEVVLGDLATAGLPTATWSGTPTSWPRSMPSTR